MKVVSKPASPTENVFEFDVDLLAKITFEGEMGQMEGCDEC